MNYTVIACRTLYDELMMAVKETQCEYPVVWVDSKYHFDPSKLRARLQLEVDSLVNADRILFAYGSCGNGLVNLRASTGELIIPKTDDCISMVLGPPGQTVQRQKETYFLTKGWMESSQGLFKEYWRTLKRYGDKKTKRIFEQMLGHYKYLMLIHNGSCSEESWTAQAHVLAAKTNLRLVETKGSIQFLKQLLTGPYDENFCIVRKGEVVTLGHFGYQNSETPRQVVKVENFKI